MGAMCDKKGRWLLPSRFCAACCLLLVTLQGLAIVEGSGIKLLEKPWTCDNFTLGACTSSQVIDLTLPEYQWISMPVIFVVNTTNSLKLCVSESIVVGGDLSSCGPKNTLLLEASKVSSGHSFVFAYGEMALLKNRTYYMQAFPSDVNHQFSTRFSLEAYYRGQCWSSYPYQNLYGECIAQEHASSVAYANDSSTSSGTSNLFPLVPKLFYYYVSSNASKFTFSLSPSGGYNYGGPSQELNYLFLWARKGNAVIYNQQQPLQSNGSSSSSVSMTYDYSGKLSTDGSSLEITVENPPNDGFGWFFAALSYIEVSTKFGLELHTCNDTASSSRVVVDATCGDIPYDITNMGGNTSLPSQHFYASKFPGDTVLVSRRHDLVLGVAKADFGKGAPSLYAAWNYVPSRDLFMLSSTSSRSDLNFLDASHRSSSSSSSSSYNDAPRYYASSDLAASGSGSADNDTSSSDGAWYILVPYTGEDWVLWTNEPCPSNCSSEGVCLSSLGYCHCTEVGSSGADCSVKSNAEMIYVAVIVSVGLFAGICMVLSIGWYRRRQARNRYERV